MRNDGLIDLMDVDTSGLLREAESRFVLGGGSVHGPAHWKAVLANGMTLAGELNADRDLVAVFALLHDCRREDEWRDPRHGARAADVARELNGRFYEFVPDRLATLTEALHWHDAGRVHTNIDISSCWAADRIELRRVGIEPAKWGFCDRTWPIAQQILANSRIENAHHV
jgi:uncharacterized protein